MGLFGRRDKKQADGEVKAAVFHPTVIEALSVLGGGWFTGTYGAMYRRQPAVRTVVDLLARNIAQLNLKVYERVSDTDRIEVNDHPLAQLMRHPNPVTTRYRHTYATVADLAIYDRAYWRKFRSGRSLAVMRISPAKLCVETDPRTLRRTYRTAQGVEIPRSQLIIFPGYSPDTDDEGVSPLETLRRVLLDSDSVGTARENMWRNAAMQSGWIERPETAPEWTDVGRARFRTDLEGSMAGTSNAGRIGVLEEGMKWNDARFRSPDDGYVDARRLTYEEVAVCYGIDPSNFGMGNETKANAEQYHQQLYSDVLPPWLRMMQDEIELQLMPEFQPLGFSTTYVEFNLADKLKGSFEDEARTLVTSTGVPIVAVNEARARMNLPRIDDEALDEPVKPMNVMYGGQPAQTIPTADPSSPLELPPGAPKTVGDVLRHHFTRQEAAVVSAKGAVTAKDAERWDRELTTDLIAFGVAATVAIAVARQVNAETYRQTDRKTVAELRAVFEARRASASDLIELS